MKRKVYEKPTDCPVCMEDLTDEENALQCGHWVHIKCVKRHFKPECPVCRHPLNIIVHGVDPNRYQNVVYINDNVDDNVDDNDDVVDDVDDDVVDNDDDNNDVEEYYAANFVNERTIDSHVDIDDVWLEMRQPIIDNFQRRHDRVNSIDHRGWNNEFYTYNVINSGVNSGVNGMDERIRITNSQLLQRFDMLERLEEYEYTNNAKVRSNFH